MEEMRFACTKATSMLKPVYVALFSDRVRICRVNWRGRETSRRDVYLDSIAAVERRGRAVSLHCRGMYVPIGFKRREDCDRFCEVLGSLR